MPRETTAPAATPADFEVARLLFREYEAALGVDLCFQNFAAELQSLPAMYGPPGGWLLLAYSEDQPVGCGGFRQLGPDLCEMKRLYLRSEVRGRGLGRRLAGELIERARAMGYRSMVLDTLPSMVEARALYHSLGFQETSPYYANPVPGALFLRLPLEPAPPEVATP